MCVIICAEKSRPTTEVVAKCWAANPYGAGASWHHPFLGKTVVHWKKDLNLKEVQELSQTLPLPFILHFRIPTAGGEVAELTHPFELGGGLDTKGSTTSGVLFHNGHWAEWMTWLATIRASLRGKIPKGPWSDSRVMAYLSRYGTDWLDELAGQRVAVMTPTGIERFGHWTESQKGQGIWFSNESWRYSFRSSYRDDDYTDYWGQRAHTPHIQILGPARTTQGTPSSTATTTNTVPATSTALTHPVPKPVTSEDMRSGDIIQGGNDKDGMPLVWIRTSGVKPGERVWNRWRKLPSGTLVLSNPSDLSKGVPDAAIAGGHILPPIPESKVPDLKTPPEGVEDHELQKLIEHAESYLKEGATEPCVES